MKTILKIAWRNVWRNRLRSGVVLASVVLGVWAGLFVVSVTLGMVDQQKRSIIQTQTSHLKIHSKKYIEDQKARNYIPNEILSRLTEFLRADTRIKSFTTRTIVDGTATTAHGFQNVKIIGIDTVMEKSVTNIYERLDTGSYLSNYDNYPVLIGKALSDEINLQVGRSVNLSFINLDTVSISLGFKVDGIFTTGHGSFDKSNLFVRESDLIELLSRESIKHEIAVVCNSIAEAESVAKAINDEFPELEARTWKELSPELGYVDEMMGTYVVVILLIIIFALTFGIVNTMLMAILERKREMGMLLCVGMNKSKVFLMIMFETIFLSFAAAPIGLLIAWGTISYFGKYGINLVEVEDAMYQFGYDTMVYTKLDPYIYGLISGLIVLAAIISSVYPARKALKYKPAEAVRAI